MSTTEAGTASAASGEDGAFSASTWTLSARVGPLGLTLVKSRSSTDPCCSTARACTSSVSPAELTEALLLDRLRRRQTSMPMASSRMLCKFVLFDMPFDAPSAHAAFFRFLSVFFELRIWLFSSSFQRKSAFVYGHCGQRTVTRPRVGYDKS